ncbi:MULTISPECIES: OmpA family protein [unclassified Thioalkalivibrio]|uniref:OmpA/MotB family protein n=1 Tax=unclassified Thioalkalivibrio TaxID=2621013 RepID=UPI0003AAFE19|nr:MULTISPECIES: OmpA family protein [unclassified Thioalkalivibrio]
MPSPGYSTSSRAAMQAEMHAQAATRPEQAFLGSYPGERQRDDEHAWILTYLDVLTLVIVVFVILLTFMDPRDDRPLASAAQPIQLAHPDHQALLDPLIAPLMGDLGDLEGQLHQPLPEADAPDPEGMGTTASRMREHAPQGVEVVEHPGRTELRIQDEILFASGQADLQPEGRTLLAQLEPLLDEHDGLITVEGHTDNIPIATERFPSNWELSSARASGVVRYLVDQGLEAERLRAVGRADTQPVARNDTARGRSENRRVALILESPTAAHP